MRCTPHYANKTSSYWTALFRVQYDASPKPRNITTHETTGKFAQLKHHPFYPRTIQRIRKFNPDKLHIGVAIPRGLSPRSLIRDRVMHRVRGLLAESLRKNGFNYDGSVRDIQEEGEASEKERFDLTGAYSLLVVKEPALLLNATSDEIRKCCDFTVKTMIENQLAKMDRLDAEKASSSPRSVKPGQKQHNSVWRPSLSQGGS